MLDEAEHGKRKDILFPAFIESVEYPYGFGRIQAANLIDWGNNAEHAGLTELLDSLRQHLNDHALESTVAKQPKPAQQTTKPKFTPSETFRDPLKAGGEGPQMVVIPAGHFRWVHHRMNRGDETLRDRNMKCKLPSHLPWVSTR